MVTKRTIDTVGGIGSILTGLACLYLAVQDRELHLSMWRVWVIVCVVLVVNGVLMLMAASRAKREPTGGTLTTAKPMGTPRI